MTSTYGPEDATFGSASRTVPSLWCSWLTVLVSRFPDRSRSSAFGEYQANPNSVRIPTISCTVEVHSRPVEDLGGSSIAARLPAVRICEARSSSPRKLISCVSRIQRYTAALKPASYSRMVVCVASYGMYLNRLTAASRSAMADISRSTAPRCRCWANCVSTSRCWCPFDRPRTNMATPAATAADTTAAGRAPKTPDQSCTHVSSSSLRRKRTNSLTPRNMGLSLREAR